MVVPSRWRVVVAAERGERPLRLARQFEQAFPHRLCHCDRPPAAVLGRAQLPGLDVPLPFDADRLSHEVEISPLSASSSPGVAADQQAVIKYAAKLGGVSLSAASIISATIA